MLIMEKPHLLINYYNNPALSRAKRSSTERIMDSNDLERERGITILAKNTAIEWHELSY